MPSPSTSAAQQKTPAASSAGRAEAVHERTAKTQPVSIALICSVKSVKCHPTGDATVVAAIGDMCCAPRIHGLRASRPLWAEIIADLLKADPFLHAQVTAKLRA